ncbi:hypothetical protein FQ185_25445 [Pseudomonas sp. ANT_H12B]|nr:hypothetical protein FQ185_25445 [Pseudomonas sp. ANT_H12B]
MTIWRGHGSCKKCLGAAFPVGASLLAIALGQTTSMLAVLASSRASSLPQVFVVLVRTTTGS